MKMTGFAFVMHWIMAVVYVAAFLTAINGLIPYMFLCIAIIILCPPSFDPVITWREYLERKSIDRS